MQDQEAKDLFAELAEEELKYEQRLGKIFAGLEQYIPRRRHGRVCQYLRNYIDNNSSSPGRPSDARIGGRQRRLFRHRFRKPAGTRFIGYYESIKSIVPEAQHEAIDHLIARERGGAHYVQLMNLRKCFL